MNEEREALMAAVVAEPDADAPRLVYADWLEEYPRNEADTARAHFIRLEIEAETMPTDSAEKTELERQAAVLFNQHHETWNADIATWNEWYDSVLVYRRGFPYELRTVFRKLALSGGKLFSLIPIQSLSVSSRVGRVFYDVNRVMTTRTRTNLLGAQHEVEIPTSLRSASLFASAETDSPHDLSRLRKLRIGPGVRVRTGAGTEQDDHGAAVFRMIAEYPSLVNLQVLSFAENHLDDDNILPLEQALRSAVFANQLQELDLSENRITNAGAHALSASSSLDQLQRLRLGGNLITTYGMHMLQNRFGSRVVL